MGNLSLPGTSSFVGGNFLIFVGVFQTNPFVATFAATGMILGGAHSIWLYNRVVFGMKLFIDTFMDVNRREFFIFLTFVFCVLWMGFYPEVFFRTNAHLRTILCSMVNGEGNRKRIFYSRAPLFEQKVAS